MISRDLTLVVFPHLASSGLCSTHINAFSSAIPTLSSFFDSEQNSQTYDPNNGRDGPKGAALLSSGFQRIDKSVRLILCVIGDVEYDYEVRLTAQLSVLAQWSGNPFLPLLLPFARPLPDPWMERSTVVGLGVFKGCL